MRKTFVETLNEQIGLDELRKNGYRLFESIEDVLGTLSDNPKDYEINWMAYFSDDNGAGAFVSDKSIYVNELGQAICEIRRGYSDYYGEKLDNVHGVETLRNKYTLGKKFLAFDTYDFDLITQNGTVLQYAGFYDTFEEMMANALEDYVRMQNAGLDKYINEGTEEKSELEEYRIPFAAYTLNQKVQNYFFVGSNPLSDSDGEHIEQTILRKLRTKYKNDEIGVSWGNYKNNVYSVAAKLLKYDSFNPKDMEENWKTLEKYGVYLDEKHFKEHALEDFIKLGSDEAITEGKGFRSAALGLAMLAGLGGSYNMIDKTNRFNEPSIMTQDATYNGDVLFAKPYELKHRVDYLDKNGKVIYSLGRGNLSSRIHNPGNLVVNNLDSARKIGAIGIWKGNGNRYAIFPDDATGEKALKNWWRKGDTHLTVREMLPRFAPHYENNLESYYKTLEKFDVPLDKKIAKLNDTEFDNLISGIKQQEGFNTNKAEYITKYAGQS